MANKIAKLRGMLGEVFDLNAAAAVLRWDQQTYMPPGGAGNRAMQLSTLSRLSHQKAVSNEMGDAIEAAKEEAAEMDPDSDNARLVEKAARDYEKYRKVPDEWVAEFSRTTSLAHQIWEKAREESDFGQFQPSLEEIIELRRQYIEFFAPYDHPYDPLLDDFERGMKTADVKAVFDKMRPQQVELIRAIADSGVTVDDSLLRQSFDEQKQWDFGVEAIEAFGFDFDRGRQDKAVHPFTAGFGIDDVRITTRFDPKFFNTAIFGTMHEAGHGMYAQGPRAELERSPLAGGASLAVHESQSRMWENLIGRSRSFWVVFYPRLQEMFSSQLGGIDLESFYRAINKVEPSLIRVEADEATYNLHIMLRFEIELGLMEKTVEMGNLPDLWNSKMEEYLGLKPPNDALGILQDVHWSAGMIGYFPTYALGNLIASQLWEKIEEDIPDITQKIEAAQFDALLEWLRENIHQHGAKFEPMELLQRITGEGLSAEPYLRYLQNKFGDIYDLS
ncbi:MAG: carboxypeptidase M32 [Anaerolineales bacterium]|nr:carboxypeptidase M32 [Anaerolineales bacterium]